MIVVLITTRMEIVTSIQVCPVSQVSINYKEMVERKAFLANPNCQIVYSNEVNMVIVPNNKKNKDY